ncbi:hypothetical protein [Pseudoxanthomonas daejeonensis]|uniref:hypothetical protein n=1 Tax=Pseudoxanthomonas daejeonensis TaxID=266062 RepID=UPI00139184BC|nr:hypothetical protein [Pseudoxanthomonas daejeonensis]
MFIRQPDHNPDQTRELHAAIRAGKIKALHALVKKGVYVDGLAFDLARVHMPKQAERLKDHQRKTYYG